MSAAIKVENLSKAYQLGEIGTGTISRDLERWVAKLRGKEDPFLKIGEMNDRSTKGTSDIVWSLKDIAFEIEQGDAVGIIGRNGAGKSTLLKILSRVTSPTSGRITGRGRIASLLEVGTGFHPELTGRENIYLNGAILGMRKKEITRKLEQIIDFSGVERYVDTPVKRYSSGMYVRLAFAVAAHLESEILIVDEVLAVGDAEFQSKCLGKMKEVSGKEGRTVLFVSHNMGAVKNLCTRGILMEYGTVKATGATAAIIEKYLAGDSDAGRAHIWKGEERPGDDTVKLESIKITDHTGSVENMLTSETDITIEIKYEILKQVKDLRIVANLMAFDGTEVFSTSDFRYQTENRLREPGHYRSHFTIPGNLLINCGYHVSVDIDIPMIRSIVLSEIASFSIEELVHNELGVTLAEKPSGIIHPVYKWTMEQII